MFLESDSMEDYNFWRDVLDTYQSFSNWLKFAWLVVPAVMFLGLTALVVYYRLALRRIKTTQTDDPE